MFLLGFATLVTLHGVVQSQTTLTGSSGPSSTNLGDNTPSGGFQSYTTTSTIDSSSISRSSGITSTESGASASDTATSNSTIIESDASTTITFLGGATATSNGTTSNSTSTSTSAQPSNTQPCNGYPEFCSRKYSNITYVAAHNSPFNRPGNAASNQDLDPITQLNDGIRMLQFQTHYENSTIYLCHTSCSILNAGTLEFYLTRVTSWLRANPYEVITILMGNSDLISPTNYTSAITTSGLLPYLYTPPTVPMSLSQWPTLSSLILHGTRAVMMLDYNANQTAVPYLLDEFAQMFETPFSPTDPSFPCTAQRPPESQPAALPRSDRMYMANHNLNVEINLGSFSLLTPAFPLLSQTNAVDGNASLGEMARNCTATWEGRPPNFLLVDYYNYGDFNGSVFQVAAEMNNVTYDRSSCCGTTRRRSGAAPRLGSVVGLGWVVGGVLALLML
ncbi:MAG: hypothetical protein Q9160_005200 [Pyrenula sp. 1 TL-2023]